MIFQIFNFYYPIRNLVFFLIETFSIFSSILIASIIKIEFIDAQVFQWTNVLPKVALITVICILSLYYLDLYDFNKVSEYGELIIRLLQALGISCLTLAAIYFFFPNFIIAEKVFMLSLFFIVSFVLCWRLVYNWVLKTEKLTEKVLILGSDELTDKIITEIKKRKDSAFKIVGILAENSLPKKPYKYQILGKINDILSVTENLCYDRLIIAMKEKRGFLPLKELLEIKLKGTTIQDGVEFYEHLTGKVMVEKVHPSYFIFSDGFKTNGIKRRIKRCLDIIFASLGLLLSLPISIITAIAIKLDSPGPVLFKQERVGERGKIFILYKFRSMHIGAEKDKPVWAKEKDPRVTRVGKIIRKLRIDEIPQMFNVLKGDMSFVGPRPERPYFVKQLKKIIPYYIQRHAVKPGITGWAQIRYPYGASVEDALEKLKYDLYYIKNMSILFDLAIVFETSKVVLLRRGAR